MLGNLAIVAAAFSQFAGHRLDENNLFLLKVQVGQIQVFFVDDFQAMLLEGLVHHSALYLWAGGPGVIIDLNGHHCDKRLGDFAKNSPDKLIKVHISPCDREESPLLSVLVAGANLCSMKTYGKEVQLWLHIGSWKCIRH